MEGGALLPGVRVADGEPVLLVDDGGADAGCVLDDVVVDPQRTRCRGVATDLEHRPAPGPWRCSR